MTKLKIIRATTVPMSLTAFCNGMLRELSEKYEVIAVSSPGKELNDIAEREGIRVIGIPMERHISILKDCKALWQMWRVFKKEKPFMVHSMTPKAGMICIVAAWIARVPVRVHTFTGLVFPTASGLKRRILMATDWLTCACATHVIPEGEGVMNDLLKNGITNKPLKVLGYGNVRGVDLSFYIRSEQIKDKSEKLRDSKRFTFLFVGRIVKDKGINELVAAFAKLHSEHSETRLWLLGPFEDSLDPVSDETRREITDNEGIETIGPKYGEELLTYYAAVDCFVLPSYREGFPNTVLEAGAMELPCIVTDINGSREIIKEGVNGMIVPPHDEEQLLNSMRVMVQSPVDRKRMASNARKMIADRFEQGFVRKCLYDFYNEIMK